MPHFSLKTTLFTLGAITLPLFTYLIWTTTSSEPTLATLTKTYATPGTSVKQDLQSIPSLSFTQEDTTYIMTDTTSDGIDIQFANQSEQTISEQQKPKLSLSFPKNYSEPVSIKLDDQRTIEITDLGGKSDYAVDTLSQEQTTTSNPNQPTPGFFKKLFSPKEKELPPTYLRYTSRDERKQLLYAYQKDQASGEKKLKHWTLYREGDGIEKEEYQFKNAKLRINGEGVAEVFYYGEQDLKNDQAVAEVDANLLERAQRTLAKEMGDDIANGTSGKTPDFTIPAPYYLDKNGDKHEAQWKVNEETNTLSVSFNPENYPVALDPTLSFTAPGVSNGGSVISGVGTGQFGMTMIAGDLNADGRTDLVVGAPTGGVSAAGVVSIFYNDGAYANTPSGADVTITGSAFRKFGSSLATGDLNTDGKTDLIVGTDLYDNTTTGAVKIFYNDGVYPSLETGSDVTITGDGVSFDFGASLATGDFNSDGRVDLAIGASPPLAFAATGKAYIFYNDLTLPTTAGTADVTITGEASSAFGVGMIAGDFNADDKTDLAVSGTAAATYAGRVYVFYNDTSYSATAAGADALITGEAGSENFGNSFAKGDFNADGKTDLVVGAYNNNGSAGKAYIFYSGSIITENASGADLSITGVSSSYFSVTMNTGDFNADGKTDLVVCTDFWGGPIEKAYIFYNDGSLPTTAATADVIITAEQENSYFGSSLTVGDFNADGKTDVVIGAKDINRAYFFYSQNGQVNTNQSITGEGTSNDFGSAMTTGDFNADGRTDLAVGATAYSSGTGRVYVFYGDGQVPSTAGTADAIITGETASDAFGSTLVAGDLNVDGKTDLVVTAPGYAVNDLGRAYIFYNGSVTTENASGADAIITGAVAYIGLGVSAVTGDLNADGETDLAVHGNYFEGYVYIFYGGSIITETTSGADVVINGDVSSSEFGNKMAVGDYNVDGETDLAVLAPAYSSRTGQVYIFYGGSIITETGSGADIIITGAFTSAYMNALVSGDLNTDGKTDLVLGAYGTPGGSYSGYVYIFYGGSIITETTSGADVTLTGPGGSAFGQTVVTGDFNADGRTDLAAGGRYYGSDTGRVYIMYNDGSLPTTADTADVMITGETTSNYFSYAMTTGDMNGDGRTDLIVGAYGNATNTGKVYFYETRENFAWEIQEQFGGTPRTGLNTSGQEIQIIGEIGSGLGYAMVTGDFNADGKMDLAVGAHTYSSSTGRAYVFFADGSLATSATNADAVIVGQATSNLFGSALISGDFNADGRTDLVVGAYGYSTNTGRTYIFYNDGSLPSTAATADVIISAEASADNFGAAIGAGDWNADGRIDLAVGATRYGDNEGRAYVFYNDGTIPTAAGSADIIITAEAITNYFSGAFSSGDFNADGKTDLIIGATGYSSSTGRAYIFYNGSLITENASGADIIITGPSTSDEFGGSITTGDLNADGRADLAIGGPGISSDAGQAFVFYGGSIITENATGSDVTISGQTAGDRFGASLLSGDWNADGKVDLLAGSNGYSSSTGRTYIFHSGSIVTENASGADVILTGETTSNYFGASLASADFNADGKTDLAVGAYGYSSSKGKTYFYTFNDPVINGTSTYDQFGDALLAGDFNADGKTDLAVGASEYYGTNKIGKAYVFFNDGIIPSAAANADAIITGEANNNYFGSALVAADFNADGKTDLVVSAYNYSSNNGRIYIFYSGSITTESASGADRFITGNSGGMLGASMAVGDLNSDGTQDLIASQEYAGKFSVFYNDGSLPLTDSAADFTDTTPATPGPFATGDFNADGRIDLAVGDTWWPGGAGAGYVYIYYNDGTFGTIDVTITSATNGAAFGASLIAGDFNTDGRTDLAIGARGYPPSATGRVYLFYNDGSIPTTAETADVTITGEDVANYLGFSLATGDMNADGRTDLIVGARQYAANAGRAYVFYNDGVYPSSAGGAEQIMTEALGTNFFGHALATGDYNNDGKIDLVVSSNYYATQTGRVYIFTSEVSAPSAVQDVSARTRGVIKARGNIKIR